ncbi:hypothetical protein A8C32_09195 [Flavivirga aquatica]|uniref:HMA domain-containing protein n=1 Tax=Flavivirga aquatica TaxID=1849968 RepID=A0A1E5SJP9_9FLAO|nr:hypothetical protein [Flavivirga aquatica]OEJ99331.1 hypothetical protein A8C32_09195 [Flavivirga aquatica]
MNLLIFRTDIKTKKKVKIIKPLFNNHSSIIKWSIDIEDIDNVLKIEATKNLNENDIINLIRTKGFYCKPL